MTIILIYMILAILYEHYGHPFTILTALPFAGFGALATLLLFNEELNIFSFVGIILLIGLVKKNGIMMVDFALQIQREQGMTPVDAIVEACRVRFRPDHDDHDGRDLCARCRSRSATAPGPKRAGRSVSRWLAGWCSRSS